ncbi:MAG: hypothetical protein JWQ04_2717 [Pedosphaera sp.]|nr:hypothetical protein [Pedosphaera sp.]
MTKSVLPLLAAMASCVCVLTGCQSPKAQPVSASIVAPSTRNNCYSLLHQLLDEEKDVSMLRFIKREHSDVKILVKKIAADCGIGSKQLEELAKHDPSIKLDEIGLPAGEMATRDAIGSTKKKALLGESGHEFELTLLLTQTEALNYAWHLAKVAGEHEPQPENARALTVISENMKNLYQEVFVMLLSKEGPSITNATVARPSQAVH